MSVNPEQPVLDAIDELVDWQMEEGLRRGDGPHPLDACRGVEMTPEEVGRAAEAFLQLTEDFPRLAEGLTGAFRGLATTLSRYAMERPEALIHEVYDPTGDNSNPDVIRIERGDTVGWRGLDGVVQTMTVEDFTVPPSGEVDMTLAEPGSTP